MFIRIKKIRHKRYAYLVKNIWSKRKKCSRQKVIKYFGPVIKPERICNDEYYNQDIKILPSKKIFKELLELELINHGFKKRGRNLIKNDIIINLFQKKVNQVQAPIVIEANEGFLCNYTLTKLYNFKTKTFNPKLEGKRLANTILQAGIILNEDIFVCLFNKLYKKP
ncbi:MAG: hypothetical protein U9Q69_05930 [Nanoarchaeota archaeon]|nr:hypothetical protein [Nanoarchaeota archaeon]